ncbi:MAG: hypothetical protein H6741_12880 [Alphaproteobacteria bacterium]|nr:hypothetical protein [Alphaproteobacteria bacterium]MCB9793610.1 hypothetical protein [Alphaproteobacteria bacterium]
MRIERPRDLISKLLVEATWREREERLEQAARITRCALRASEHGAFPSEYELYALHRHANALTALGRNLEALGHLNRLLAWAQRPSWEQRLGDVTADRLRLHASIDWVCNARELPPLPLSACFEVLDACEAWLRVRGRPSWRASLECSRASLRLQLDQPELALPHARRALHLMDLDREVAGFTRSSASATLAEVLCALGQLDEAERRHHDTLEDPESSAFIRRVSLHGLARVQLARGDMPAALRLAERALDWAEGTGPSALHDALGVLTAARRAGGALEEAERSATRRLRLSQGLSARARYLALRDALELALEREDAAAVERLREAISPLAGAMDAAVGDGRHGEALARLLWPEMIL